MTGRKILLVANTDWYLYNFRLGLACHLRDLGNEVVLVSPAGEYAARLEQAGFRWIPIPFSRRSTNPLTEWAPVVALARLYRREAPDLVHHFTIKPVVYGSLAARVSGVPGIVNAVAGMGVVYASKGRAMLRAVVDTLLRLAMRRPRTQLILQNPDDVAVFAERRLAPATRVHLIRGSGVNGERFRPSNDEGHDGPCQLLFAARLLWPKGIEHYVAAGRRYRERGDATFLVAGNADTGNPDAVPQTQLDAWSADGRIELLGHVDDMAALLARVDVVVLPSRYGEGVPRVLVEAAASGRPLVAFDVPGSREIVIDGVNGFLLAPGDQTGLDAAIDRLIAEPALRAQMGLASRRHFDSEYDEATVFAKTLQIYDQALEY